MITAPTDLEFRLLEIPAALDAPDAADFVEMTRVRNLIRAEISGHDDHSLTAAEILPTFAPDPMELRFLWLALLGSDVVGFIGLDVPQEPGSRVAYWTVELLRSVWSRGIGSAAMELVERVAREHERTVLQTWVEHPAAAGDRLVPPTGFGSIPVDHAARFLLRHGHHLEQVMRHSVLELIPAPPRVPELLEQATTAAAGYRVVQWQLPTPPEFVDGYGWMKSRMITDAPAAGMEYDEEVWDAARVARHDATFVDAGRLVLVTAAQHLDSGELVAFNELIIGSDRTRVTAQHDTLVLADHRGHRLGMLVKTAALVSWREIAPASPRVRTDNAEENRPMLDINETIGFVPDSYEGAWKKVLAP
ncbi:GNAT family N-acetyltransferase [Microbacterium sp. P05]|uniref:GNAT family N-acetyltransferase n=1 Tax=Microbacterium sp. P05 TaxID=3366948 RepID=UPI003746A7E1